MRWSIGELGPGNEPEESLGAIKRLWLQMVGPMATTTSVKGAVVYLDEARFWPAKQSTHLNLLPSVVRQLIEKRYDRWLRHALLRLHHLVQVASYGQEG